MERIEHLLVKQYITHTSRVLELGARFGTTSCALAAATRNTGRVVSVEPDHRVWSYLRSNRQSHRCSIHIVREPVGNTNVVFRGGNYDSTGVAAPRKVKRDASGRPLYYTYTELQEAVGFTFTALLIDCEGCIDRLFEGTGLPLQTLLKDVRVILLEADNPKADNSPCKSQCVDYESWVEKFTHLGFRVDKRITDKKFPWIEHFAFTR